MTMYSDTICWICIFAWGAAVFAWAILDKIASQIDDGIFTKRFGEDSHKVANVVYSISTYLSILLISICVICIISLLIQSYI